MSLDLASMEDGILEAIDAIRPALQSDGGDIVFQARRRRRRARLAGRRLRHLPGVDDDAEGRRRADHHGPRPGRHRGRRRRVAPARVDSTRMTADTDALVERALAGDRRRDREAALARRAGRRRRTRGRQPAAPAHRPRVVGRDHRRAGRGQVDAHRRARRRACAPTASRSACSRSIRRARSAAARSSATACACSATRPIPACSSARWRRAVTSAVSRSRRRRRCACSTRSARRGSSSRRSASARSRSRSRARPTRRSSS